MRNVLLADVALWSALIILAALIIIGRWRRSHSWMHARAPREEAPEQAGQQMPAPQPARRAGPGEHTKKPDGAAPRPAPPRPAPPPQATQLANPEARPHRPATPRNDRQSPTRAATSSQRIASYYDHADQPIADYLAALGWTRQAAHADPDFAAAPPDGTAGPLTRSQQKGYTAERPRPRPAGTTRV
jgi:hypothetical protein